MCIRTPYGAIVHLEAIVTLAQDKHQHILQIINPSQ